MNVDRRWPGGLVPYEFDASVRATEKDILVAALDEWRQRTRVVAFVPRGNEKDHVLFGVGHGGHSAVGRVGGAQRVQVPRGFGPGLVLHETGHALGLYHEHTRPDRDQWVKVYPENALPQDRAALEVIEPRLDATRPYDYGSIMHYGRKAFARPGLVTLEPLQQLPVGVVLGAWLTLGRGDIESIHLLYGRAFRP